MMNEKQWAEIQTEIDHCEKAIEGLATWRALGKTKAETASAKSAKAQTSKILHERLAQAVRCWQRGEPLPR